jgi:excisionase family DNA binding protein
MATDTLLLRPDEVSRRLNLSRSKVYGMLKRGELPCVRMGRSVRVPADELVRWLAGTDKSLPTVEHEDIDVEKLL